MKTILTIIVIMLIPFFINTKDHLVIQGQVSDSETLKALADCHVYINDKSVGTITDINGRFSLRVPYDCKDQTLHISRIGYGNFKGKAKRICDKPIKIHLISEPVWLDTVTIRPDNSKDEQAVASAADLDK